MAVATYTYESLPPEEQRALPDAQHLIDAIAADDSDYEARQPKSGWSTSKPASSQRAD